MTTTSLEAWEVTNATYGIYVRTSNVLAILCMSVIDTVDSASQPPFSHLKLPFTMYSFLFATPTLEEANKI